MASLFHYGEIAAGLLVAYVAGWLVGYGLRRLVAAVFGRPRAARTVDAAVSAATAAAVPIPAPVGVQAVAPVVLPVPDAHTLLGQGGTPAPAAELPPAIRPIATFAAPSGPGSPQAIADALAATPAVPSPPPPLEPVAAATVAPPPAPQPPPEAANAAEALAMLSVQRPLDGPALSPLGAELSGGEQITIRVRPAEEVVVQATVPQPMVPMAEPAALPEPPPALAAEEPIVAEALAEKLAAEVAAARAAVTQILKPVPAATTAPTEALPLVEPEPVFARPAGSIPSPFRATAAQPPPTPVAPRPTVQPAAPRPAEARPISVPAAAASPAQQSAATPATAPPGDESEQPDLFIRPPARPASAPGQAWTGEINGRVAKRYDAEPVHQETATAPVAAPAAAAPERVEAELMASVADSLAAPVAAPEPAVPEPPAEPSPPARPARPEDAAVAEAVRQARAAVAQVLADSFPPAAPPQVPEAAVMTYEELAGSALSDAPAAMASAPTLETPELEPAIDPSFFGYEVAQAPMEPVLLPDALLFEPPAEPIPVTSPPAPAAPVAVAEPAVPAPPPALSPEPVVTPPARAEAAAAPPAPPAEPAYDEDAAMRAIEGGWSRGAVRGMPNAPDLPDVSAAVAAAQVAVEQVLVKSGVEEGRAQLAGKPRGMARPRGGMRDNLKAIGGLNLIDENTLNNLGVWSFDQIAGWDAGEVLWLENHAFARGRIGREDWQGQARTLIAARAARTAK